MNSDEPKGVTCECGEYAAFDLYAYAHWDIELTRACSCGRRLTILRGHVVAVKNPPRKTRRR